MLRRLSSIHSGALCGAEQPPMAQAAVLLHNAKMRGVRIIRDPRCDMLLVPGHFRVSQRRKRMKLYGVLIKI